MVSTSDVKHVHTGTGLDNTSVAENQPPRMAVDSFSTTDSHTGEAFTCSLEKGYFCCAGSLPLPK